MKKHYLQRSRMVYVGFLNYRPHIQIENGARVLAAYTSKTAAQRAYRDVRKARLVFDANWYTERSEKVTRSAR